MPRRLAPLLLAPALLLLPFLGGCRSNSPAAADREAYGALAQRRLQVPEATGSLHVEAADRLAASLRVQQTFRLSLDDAVSLALAVSRDFRREREDVYLAALDLTLARNRYRPLPFASGGSALDLMEDGSTVRVGGEGGFTQRLANGGVFALGLALNVLKNLSGNPIRTAQTVLDANLTLPILRGSGPLVELEPLRQAERSTIYALRSFARFQQELRVRIASQYFAVLALRDTWQNEERAYESLRVLVDEQTVRAEAGKIAEFQLDQARQDLLRADDRRQRARRRFDDAKDQLKVDLAIPVLAEIELEGEALERLRNEEPTRPSYDLDTALKRSSRARLDLRNARDQTQDAIRQIEVARDALRAGLDLSIGGALRSPSDRPLDIENATADALLGLDVDLPLERTAERNALRRAWITARRVGRTEERLEDQVYLAVRAGWRRLLEAERSIAIQKEGVRLAERRVESTTLLLEQGSATIRDRLEAEDARVQARNALTSALVDFAVTLLEVERDIGTLPVVPAATAPPPEATSVPLPTEGALPLGEGAPVLLEDAVTVPTAAPAPATPALGPPPLANELPSRGEPRSGR